MLKPSFLKIAFLLVFAALANPEAANAAAPPTDYFARYKYDVKGALELLRKADGQALTASVDALKLLEDLGYWPVVRKTGAFQFTAELQAQVEAQYKYLEKAFSYEAGDLVWVMAENDQMKPYGIGRVNHRAHIKSHFKSQGTDFYLVDVYVDGPQKMTKIKGRFYDGHVGDILYYGDNYALEKQTRLYTKTELDLLNSPSSSLPVDDAGEKLNWEKDQIWLDKLNAFKEKMTAKAAANGGLSVIDWKAGSQEIERVQQETLVEFFRFFKMDRNAPSNSGKGIGLRASGGGVCYDQALVLTYAIQGVGQPLGLKAYNLDGTTVNPMGGHGFVRVELKGHLQTITHDVAVDYNNRSAIKYKGQTVKTNNVIYISDPGWADYGVTPDQFAKIEQADALNPRPINSNRAVNGRSNSRLMTEVSHEMKAKGPLGVMTEQKLAKITSDRLTFATDVEKAVLAGETDPVDSAMKNGKHTVFDCKSLLK